MSEQLIFTVYDQKAQAYLSPFVTKTKGLAIRMFEELVNQAGHQFYKFPADYTLYCVGLWDETNGVATPTSPENMGTAIQYLAGSEDLKLED